MRRPASGLRLGLACAAALSLVPVVASAQVTPPTALPPPAEESAFPALAIGAAITLIPISAGAILWANDGSQNQRNAGLGIVHAGLLVGPFVGYLVGKEKKRGLVHGGIALGLGALQALLVGLYPNVLRAGDSAGTPLTTQGAFYSLLSASTLWAALGFADVAMGPARRARLRAAAMALPPALPHAQGALTFGVAYP